MPERETYGLQGKAPFPIESALTVSAKALQALAETENSEHTDGIAGAATDPVVKHLRLAMQPVLDRPEEACKLLVSHVTMALRAYCTHTYGGAGMTATVRGGLAPWQVRRAKEMLMEHLEEDISLSEVARGCKLSVSHFARAFRQTTGLPPHRWLVSRRVDRAKGLLRQSKESMAEIALRCGFSDQASFARAFKRVVGKTPGEWRRNGMNYESETRIASDATTISEADSVHRSTPLSAPISGSLSAPSHQTRWQAVPFPPY
jgi:AraC-like DNA-binding protein